MEFKSSSLDQKEETLKEKPSPDKNISQIQDFLPIFQFETIDSNNSGIPHETLKVLSFNILADAYFGVDYPYCETEYSNFAYRGPQTVKFIEALNPDVFCFQEVDHYKDFYYQALSKKFMLFGEIKDNVLKVGLMIGFKKDSFKFLEKMVICYADYVTEESVGGIKPIENFMRDHRALIVEIESIKNKQKYIIANTHVFWDYRQKHVQQFQVLQLIKNLEARYEKSAEIIICGDFNSTPETEQIQFVTNPTYFGSEKNLIYQNCGMKEKKLQFESCYANYRQKTKNNQKITYPSFTNLVPWFKGVLDYIFYNKNSKLKLKSVLKIPKKKELVALPKKGWPSDHVPIMAEFWVENLEIQQEENSKDNSNE